MSKFPSYLILKISFIFYIYLVFSTLSAIAKNIYQSASFYSLTSLKLVLSNFQSFGWMSDYYPVSDLYSYGIALAAFAVLCFVKTDKLDVKYPIFVLWSALIASATYGVIQSIYRVGFIRDIYGRGVNGIFPDLHSYAGFHLIGFVSGLYAAISNGEKKLRIFAATVMVFSFAGLIVSGSRSSILIAVVMLFALVGKRAISKGTKVRYGVILLIVGILFYFWMTNYGIGKRKLSFFVRIFNETNFDKLNLYLSQRPGIYLASVKMWWSEPWFGLGQGTFFRNSEILEFAGSKFFAGRGGGNAHNYFLQTLAELGIVGFTLFITPFIIVIKKAVDPMSRILVWMIIGLFLGNIFAHSMLIRPMLTLAYVLLGLIVINEKDTLEIEWIKRTSKKFWMIVLALLAVIAIQEKYRAVGRLPLTYGSKCFVDIHNPSDDTSAAKRYIEVKPAESFSVSFKLTHPDVAEHPVTVVLSLLDSEKNVLSSQNHSISDLDEHTYKLSVEKTGSKPKYLLAEADRCFVPLSYGINLDTRRLAFRGLKVEENIATEKQ